MVKGLETFKTFFEDYPQNYILIGGAACDVLFTQAGLPFRATRDLDVVLVVEALNAQFVKRFWDFVKSGGYQIGQKGQGQRRYYRFLKPDQEDFPAQLELFSRLPDLLDVAEDSHLTPIPVDEALSSLSAILMDKDYYGFILEQSFVANGLHLATAEALLCFKARAFLDLRIRKEQGAPVDEKDIRKHKNDSIRLSMLLGESSNLSLPPSIRNDMKQFLERLKAEPPDLKAIGRNMKIPLPGMEVILEQIKKTYDL